MAQTSTKNLKAPQKKGKGCLIGCLGILFVPILLVGGFFFFATAELRRSDEEVLKTYVPSPEIAEIAEKNTLTDKGRATFYRSHPELVDGEVFRKYCFANGVEALGCIGPRRGGGPFGGRQIYLLKIDDPEFSDHKFSASVHEMLHGAYERLSSDEKEQVNSLVENEFSKRQDDLHLLSIAEILKERQEKGKGKQTILDELHSKFAVEFTDLSPELEEYYKQYFVDRAKAVELYRNGGFNSRLRRMDELNYEGEQLNSRLTTMQGQLTAYQNAGDMTSYNGLVDQFNSIVNQYNAKVAESRRIYSEIEKFYAYFNPDYKPPEEKPQ